MISFARSLRETWRWSLLQFLVFTQYQWIVLSTNKEYSHHTRLPSRRVHHCATVHLPLPRLYDRSLLFQRYICFGRSDNTSLFWRSKIFLFLFWLIFFWGCGIICAGQWMPKKSEVITFARSESTVVMMPSSWCLWDELNSQNCSCLLSAFVKWKHPCPLSSTGWVSPMENWNN